MDNIVLERTWKRSGTLYVECIDGNLYTGEEQAHTFRITGQNEQGTVTPITGTITGKFLRADNLDVPLVGSLDDGVAVLTLTEQCYDCRGRYVLSIFVDDGEHKICIYCGTGNVFRTDGEGTIDPGNIIQDVSDLIDRIQTAIGQIPADYSALTARVTQTEADVSDLKSAIDDFAEETEASANLFPGVYTTGKSLNADGTLSDNTDRSVTDFIPVEAETAYYTHYGVSQGLVNFVRVNCYAADKTNVLGTTINANTFTTPSGTEYVRICSGTAYFELYYALTNTSATNPYEEYHPSEWVIKADPTLTDKYRPAEAKATGDAITALEERVNAEIANFSESLDYIDELKTNVYVHEEPVNLMPSIQTETNILADGTTESNSSYAVSSKCAVKPGKKIVFTRQMTSAIRGVERFKVVFFNGDTVASADVTMSDSARTVPSTATHAIVGFYNSYAAENYAPMVEYGDGTAIEQEYSEYFAPFDTCKPSVTQRNASKKLCVFGDSLAANGNGGNDYWAYIVGNKLGFSEIYNRGVGSSRVANTATLYAWIDSGGDSYNRGAYASMPSNVPAEYSTQINACMSGDDRALTIPVDTDVLLILAGANDASTIGTIGIDAFKTAYGLMLDKIFNRVPNAKIYLCTPPFNANWDLGEASATYQAIRTAVKEMGQLYGYPIIDLKSDMMVNKNNYQTYMNDDGVHFNTASGRNKTAEAVIPHLYGYVYVE